jgi:hypothetical protein
MGSWFQSLFRSGRVAEKLKQLAIVNNIIFEAGGTSWTSDAGKHCMIIDNESNESNESVICKKILNVVQQKTITGNEQFFFILMDLDKEPVAKLPADVCDDPKSHISVYNCLENIDAQILLERLQNNMILLLCKFYGVCSRKFNCYVKSNYNYKKAPQTLGAFTPNASALCAQSRNNVGGDIYMLPFPF